MTLVLHVRPFVLFGVGPAVACVVALWLAFGSGNSNLAVAFGAGVACYGLIVSASLKKAELKE
jgi:hypothetical protein